MKGFLLPLLLLAFVTIINVVVPFHAASFSLLVPPQGSAMETGVYDPHGDLNTQPGIAMQHIFIDWNTAPAHTLQGLKMAEANKRSLMVTLEPFPRPGQRPGSFVDDLLAGEYDRLITAHCHVLSQAEGTVFLRFAHEMDIENGRYAWSGLPPRTYVWLYRHAISLCRKSAPHVVSVWSPVGNASLANYYPGSDLVDMVGLSLFGLQPWEEIFYGHSRSFAEAFDEKYRRVAGYGKPVTIAEFGVCGTPVYRTQWLADAIGRGGKEFPLLRSIIYFNDREPYRWPETGVPQMRPGCDVEFPDWRLGRPK